MAGKECSKGCGRQATRRGMCGAHYNQQRERQIAYGRWQTVYTDAEPARQHIKKLQAAGVGLRRIEQLAGVNRKTLQWIMNGRTERGTAPCQKITTANAERILAVPVPDVVHRVVAQHQCVPAIGTVRRLQALVRFGYTRRYLAQRLGISDQNATHLFRTSTKLVIAETAVKVERLFAELQLVQGPSVRAANEGRKRRWPLPFDWDEETIDNPAATPQRHLPSEGRRTDEATAQRRERVAELTKAGWSARCIAQHLRINERTVQRDRMAS